MYCLLDFYIDLMIDAWTDSGHYVKSVEMELIDGDLSRNLNLALLLLLADTSIHHDSNRDHVTVDPFGEDDEDDEQEIKVTTSKFEDYKGDKYYLSLEREENI